MTTSPYGTGDSTDFVEQGLGEAYKVVRVVYDVLDDINTTAANDLNITTVAANIANVNLTGPNIANVNATGINIANVNTVAGNLLGANTVSIVAGSIVNVNAVGTNINAVTGVNTNIANVNTVAISIGSVNTVAPNLGNVNIVATDITSVNSAATNMAAIIAAPAQAAAAATSATNAANSAALIPNASHKSLWPDPWFETSGGLPLTTSNKIAIYSQLNTETNRTWNGSYKHPFGKGAWVYDPASATTLMGFNDSWAMDSAAEVLVAAGDVVSIAALVIAPSGTVSIQGRFYDAITGGGTGYTFNGGQINGSAGVTMDGTPKLLKLENQTVPVNATGINFWLVDVAASAFNVIALWVVRGAVAGDRPPVRKSHEQAYNLLASDITPIKSQADYAVIPVDALSTAATAVHSAATVTQGSFGVSPFAGWGQAFTKASVSPFNGIRVRNVFQPAGTTPKWSKLVFDVYTHATAAQTGSIVATCTMRIDNSLATIPQIDAPLRDPVSGAFLTTAQVTALLLADVMVSYRAQDVTGAWTWVGNLLGTVSGPANRQSYYWQGTSQAWLAYSGNLALAIELISVAAPAITTSYKPSVALRTDLGVSATPVIPYFTLPANVNAVVGTEVNLYFDAIFSAHSMGLTGLEGFSVSIVGTKGKNMERGFRYTPVAGDVGTVTMTAKAWDDAGGLVATKTFTLTTIAATPKAAAKNVMVVGASIVAAGIISSTAQADFAALGAVIPIFVGTQGTAPGKFEGYGGKKYADYVTAGVITYEFTVSGVTTVNIGATYTTGGVTYTVTGFNITAGSGTVQTTGASAPGASGTLTKASGAGDATIAFSASTSIAANKFWNAAIPGLDIANFRSVNSIGVIDAVVIPDLGINDIFGEGTSPDITGIVNNAKTLSTAFITDNASCKVVHSMLPISGNTGDGFAANYGAAFSRQVYEANLYALRLALIAAFDNGAYHANVSIGTAGAQIDRYYGYTLSSGALAARIPTTSSTHVNAVHPAAVGYQQLGDAIYGSLMAVLP